MHLQALPWQSYQCYLLFVHVGSLGHVGYLYYADYILGQRVDSRSISAFEGHGMNL